MKKELKCDKKQTANQAFANAQDKRTLNHTYRFRALRPKTLNIENRLNEINESSLSIFLTIIDAAEEIKQRNYTTYNIQEIDAAILNT